MDFLSAAPAIVKSIKQRELLNYWLRLYAKHERLPAFDTYQPDRLADERDDLVYIVVKGAGDALRFVIDRHAHVECLRDDRQGPLSR